MSDTVTIFETNIDLTIDEESVNVILSEEEITVIEIGEVIMTNTQDHDELIHRGLHTHAQIDNHLADTDIHIINNTVDGGLFQP